MRNQLCGLLAACFAISCASGSAKGTPDAAIQAPPCAAPTDARPAVLPDAGGPGPGCPDGGARSFVEHRVPVSGGTLYAREWAGPGPAIVLMHGFPDNLHLYDALLPKLSCRRVIAFDFLGWGQSDKPSGRTYTAASQTDDVDAVMTYFALDDAVLVVHDSSGPPGIHWAIAHPERTNTLVLLNTYYALTPNLRAPEAITIFMQPGLQPVEDAIVADPAASRSLYSWQVGQFITDPTVAASLVPALFAEFLPGALPAFRSLNDSLLADVGAQTASVGELAKFPRPVKIVFGADDVYLNAGVARDFHGFFPTSTLTLVPHARHYVQVDQPARVAAEILR